MSYSAVHDTHNTTTSHPQNAYYGTFHVLAKVTRASGDKIVSAATRTKSGEG